MLSQAASYKLYLNYVCVRFSKWCIKERNESIISKCVWGLVHKTNKSHFRAVFCIKTVTTSECVDWNVRNLILFSKWLNLKKKWTFCYKYIVMFLSKDCRLLVEKPWKSLKPIWRPVVIDSVRFIFTHNQ